MRPPRVLFAGGGTGGHLYPALALAEALQRREPDAEILFVGAKRGIEARVLPERGVRYRLLPLEPLRRARPWETWRLVPSMLLSYAGLRRVFRHFRPDVVVGTGGYASGPVVGYAILRGVPTALQEQNSFPGLVTRTLAPRTRQLHLAFPEARERLRPGKRTEVFVLGNPIRPPDPGADRDLARAKFGLGGGTVALVVGGSQGARAINEALLADLRGVAEGRFPARPAGLEILWATGPQHFASVEERLRPLDLAEWVHVQPYIEDMPSALAAADLAVSRSGAMALAELCAWGIPSILVPYPHAAADHQVYNATALAEAGAARMVLESDLASGRLWGQLLDLAGDPESRATVAAAARGRGFPDAADRIVDALSTLW
jgi:UDP-N-acetylglucosamine--N-acetylmuramyl-(pentapeptide) pyrophosphoryl-undecaprenol N-acetylglucosamine transferase